MSEGLNDLTPSDNFISFFRVDYSFYYLIFS